MKHVVWICLLGTMACGSSPAAPSRPMYPALMATWAGTASIGVTGNGVPVGTNLCETTWLVTSQTEAAFTGTFTLSGGSVVPCVQASSFTGTVTPDGAVTVAYTSGPPTSNCVLTTGTPLSGVVTGATLTLQQTNHFTCAGQPADQVISVSLTKR